MQGFFAGDSYLDHAQIEACLHRLAQNSSWTALKEIGRSREGRAIYSMLIGKQDGDILNRPMIWIDGGTHAIEWVSVMSSLYTMSRWLEALENGEPHLCDWFSNNSAIIVPCISPDGYEETLKGSPYFRSVKRKPLVSEARVGLEASDINSDQKCLFMRFKDPLGTMVPDEEEPMLMRPRMLGDDPDNAYFLSFEGHFINWDKTRMVGASLKHGLDLNRNFPARWQPFSMFGQDSGDFPLSEPESRAVIDEFSRYPYIGAALTNHSYTGCILTQPYSKNTPLQNNDIELMYRLATDITAGTGYKTLKVATEFSYDGKSEIIGVWADTITTIFGVPGYTLELWDPYSYAQVENKDPAKQFHRPDLAMIRGLFKHFKKHHPEVFYPWQKYPHPDLGEVELGGIDYMRAINNPPQSLLAKECHKGFMVADKLRKALPQVSATLSSKVLGDVREISLTLKNSGYLSTSLTEHGQKLRPCPKASAEITLAPGMSLVSPSALVSLDHLEGYGSLSLGFMGHPLYPLLSPKSQQTKVSWLVKGLGSVQVKWHMGRAGQGRSEI